MRALLLLLLFALPACAATPDLRALSGALGRDDARRGAVEIAVKGNHAALLDDIASGGGPALTRAFDAARVPLADRPARRLQLAGDLELHAANPGALVTTLMLWGG